LSGDSVKISDISIGIRDFSGSGTVDSEIRVADGSRNLGLGVSLSRVTSGHCLEVPESTGSRVGGDGLVDQIGESLEAAEVEDDGSLDQVVLDPVEAGLVGVAGQAGVTSVGVGGGALGVALDLVVEPGVLAGLVEGVGALRVHVTSAVLLVGRAGAGEGFAAVVHLLGHGRAHSSLLRRFVQVVEGVAGNAQGGFGVDESLAAGATARDIVT
jgi:hypothetical protein